MPRVGCVQPCWVHPVRRARHRDASYSAAESRRGRPPRQGPLSWEHVFGDVAGFSARAVQTLDGATLYGAGVGAELGEIPLSDALELLSP